MFRWYLGIQSKKDPAHVMNEVYKAMQSLKCVWHQVNNYRVLCLWKYTSGIVQKPASSPSHAISVSTKTSSFVICTRVCCVAVGRRSHSILFSSIQLTPEHMGFIRIQYVSQH